MKSSLVLLLLGVLATPSLGANELLWGGEGVWGTSGAGAAVSFSGLASGEGWLFGGYGSGSWSPGLGLAGGGALGGFQRGPLMILGHAGLGAGFLDGDPGATRQAGLEVAWGGPGLVLKASWERVWDLTGLPALPARGIDRWGFGIGLRNLLD